MATFKIGKVLMKSLFKKPATKMYPVIPNEFQERTRGQVTIEKVYADVNARQMLLP